MEQHPIPQNVTTFQFRLIGDMTIKQFGLIAICCIIGYFFYKVIPLPEIITAAIGVLIALLGFGLAFVPIEERPMDVWILSFIKSVYSPTVYVWQKSKQKEEVKPKNPVATTPMPADALASEMAKLKDALTGVAATVNAQMHKNPAPTPEKTTAPVKQPPVPAVRPPEPVRAPQYSPVQPVASPVPTISPSVASVSFTPLWQQSGAVHNTSAPQSSPTASIYGEKIVEKKRQMGFLDWFIGLFTGRGEPKSKIHPTGSTIASALRPQSKTEQHSASEQRLRSDDKSGASAELKKVQQETAALSTTVDKLKAELESKKTSESRVVELQRELVSTLSDKEKMELELAELRQKVADANKTSAHGRTTPNTVATTTTPTVRIITPEAAPNVGLPKLTTFPNVVTGIIKDSDSNLLPGVLVTVRDKTGMPLRALKSNKLGQIAASTPLPNGTYVVEVEDPRNRFVFDRAQITLTGDVMPPIEITARSQKEVMRSKLEKEIFGNQIK